MAAMDTTTQLVTRSGYLNTGSSAGRPRTYSFSPDDISWVAKWHNVYGNPSYCIVFARDAFVFDDSDSGEPVPADSLYLVDNFQGTSDFGRAPGRTVARRKHLFDFCRWS